MTSEAQLQGLIHRDPLKSWVDFHHTILYPAVLVLVLAGYVFAGLVGLAIPFTSGNISPVWPASGIAVAALIVFGYRVWPAIAVGAFLVNFFSPIPFVAALAIAAGNTAGALAGVWLLRTVTGFRGSLSSLRDVISLITFGAFCGPALSATVGSIALFVTSVNPWSGFNTAWLMWYLGDAVGVLIIAPILLAVAALKQLPEQREIVSFTCLLLGTLFSSLLIFDHNLGIQTGDDLFAFAVFPFVMWGAIRFEAVGAASVTLLISVVVLSETANGFGPFAKSDSLHNAGLLQTFLGVISISGMTLAAVNSERVQMISEREAFERKEAIRIAALEMEIARKVQRKLLPQQAPPLVTFEYDALTVQARSVGGDYFDYIDLGNNQVAFVVADISGKGICAALLMANLQGALRSQIPILTQDLPQSLQCVNRLFYESTELHSFATLFVGIYDDMTRTLNYVNCGHNPPLVLRGENVIRLTATATVIGMFEKWECVREQIALIPGDMITFYTDGVIEAENANAQQFGEEGLIQIMENNRNVGAAVLLEKIIAGVQDFESGEQSDDLTLLTGYIH